MSDETFSHLGMKYRDFIPIPLRRSTETESCDRSWGLTYQYSSNEKPGSKYYHISSKQFHPPIDLGRVAMVCCTYVASIARTNFHPVTTATCICIPLICGSDSRADDVPAIDIVVFPWSCSSTRTLGAIFTCRVRKRVSQISTEVDTLSPAKR